MQRYRVVIIGMGPRGLSVLAATSVALEFFTNRVDIEKYVNYLAATALIHRNWRVRTCVVPIAIGLTVRRP